MRLTRNQFSDDAALAINAEIDHESRLAADTGHAIHEFKGRSDRYCEVCNLPDRHQVHSIGRVLSPRQVMTHLASPSARESLKLQPKCCKGCGKPLGEMDAANTQLFIGDVVFLSPVVFLCRKKAGGCGEVNRWGPSRKLASIPESVVL